MISGSAGRGELLPNRGQDLRALRPTQQRPLHEQAFLSPGGSARLVKTCVVKLVAEVDWLALHLPSFVIISSSFEEQVRRAAVVSPISVTWSWQPAPLSLLASPLRSQCKISWFLYCTLTCSLFSNVFRVKRGESCSSSREAINPKPATKIRFPWP